MASPSVTYSFSNGTTADATQVNANFTDVINGITDGTKDLSISALTCAGNVALNGNTTIGNASGDDLTVTASLASTIPIKTTNSYDIGSSTLGLRALYFGANSQTVKIQGSSSMSATWTFTWPVTAGTANYALTTNGSGVAAWTAWSTSAWLATSTTPGTVDPQGGTGILYSDTYTPTLANVSNTSAHGVVAAGYCRIGKFVMVFATVDFTAGAAGIVSFSMTLPAAATSDFSASTDAWGGIAVGRTSGTQYGGGYVEADATNNWLVVYPNTPNNVSNRAGVFAMYTIK